MKTLAQVWPGRDTPCCGDRVLCGVDTPLFSVSIVLLILHAGAFALFVAPNFLLSQRLIAIDVGFTLLCLSLLFMASFTEPGILPRCSPREDDIGDEDDDEDDIVVTPFVSINGSLVELKYCNRCHIYRPPRSRHCSYCDHCIEDFDHHCEWLSHCVGRRNYRFFLLFLFSVATFDMCMLVICGVDYLKMALRISWAIASKRRLASLILGASNFIILSLLGSLLAYHLSLISTGKTTYEDLRGYYGDVDPERPRQFWKNLLRILATPTPPSRVPLDALVNENGCIPGSRRVVTPNVKWVKTTAEQRRMRALSRASTWADHRKAHWS